jgi:hypothetical protein
MINVKGTSSALSIVTTVGSCVSKMHVSYVEYPDGNATGTLQSANSSDAGSSTTTLLAAHATTTTGRNAKLVTVTNTDAALTQNYTLKHHDGTSNITILAFPLGPGESVWIGEDCEPRFFDASGRLKSVQVQQSPTTSVINVVSLGSDVVNNNASANTIADVTGLSFAVVAGQTYEFEFVILYTANASTTGSRWSINGPGSPTQLAYTSRYPLTATTETFNYAQAYDIPAAANATSLTTGNVAVIKGVITPSSNGTVIARFASEVSSAAITAKVGSVLKWIRTN